MTDFHIDQKLTHPDHGDCMVTFVGNDYIGVEFSDGGNALIKKDTFQKMPDVREKKYSSPSGRSHGRNLQ